MQRLTNKSTARIRVDPDGNVRVTARILKEGVFNYVPSEMKNSEGVELIDGYIKEYIPRSEFTDAALSSLEGKPVIIGDHEWQTAGVSNKDSRVVGNVAGRPRVVNGGIECDFLINDPDVIDALKRKTIHDVSAGYELDFEPESGTFNGIKYSGIQRNFRFNHVLLLPFGDGRCGTDVRVFNKKSNDGGNVVKVIKTTVGNKAVEYRFNSEEDAAQAEQMVEDQKAFNAEELGAAMECQAQLKKQIDDLTAQYNEAMQTIEAQKAQIDKLFTTESMESLANEALEQKEDESAILDDAAESGEMSEEDVAETKEEVGNAKTYAERRAVIVKRVFQAMNRKVDHWDEARIDAAFETLAVPARMRAENRKKATVLNGTKTQANNGKPDDFMNNRSRMLKPMHANNKKGE